MKFLRICYYLYLSLLPTLAVGALGQTLTDPISRWWFVALFLGVIVFLDVVAELIPYPKTLPAALITTLGVPIQVYFALADFGNIWFIFAYQFLIEAAGALLGIGLFGILKAGHGEKPSWESLLTVIGKILVVIVLLTLPAVAILKLYGPLFGQLTWSWNTLFLVTALVSVLFNTIRRLNTSERKGSDEYFGYIIIGIFAFIFGGPFLYHFFR